MEKKRYILFLIGALAVALFAFAGCDDDDDDPVAVAPMTEVVAIFGVGGGGGPMKAEGDLATAFVSVGGVDVIPTCEVNGVEMGLEPEFTVYGGALGYYGMFNLGAGNAVNMTVDMGDDGTCEFDGSLPGASTIVGNSRIDVTYGEPCTATWTASADADAYWYSGYMNMRYYDTGGSSHYTYGNVRGMTTATSITINVADEFDDVVVDFDYVDYISGNFYVQPISGPLNPGDASNITGVGEGFALLLGEQLRWELDESAPLTAEQERELQFDALKELIRSLR